jgi:sugar-specific transcriptional regulator TrmB
MGSPLEDQMKKLEDDVIQIKKQLRKRREITKLTLKEKFSIHDRAQNFIRQFETTTWMVPPEQYKELKEIVTYLSKLVDNALGVKFP